MKILRRPQDVFVIAQKVILYSLDVSVKKIDVLIFEILWRKCLQSVDKLWPILVAVVVHCAPHCNTGMSSQGCSLVSNLFQVSQKTSSKTWIYDTCGTKRAKNIFIQRWHRNLVPKFPCHNSTLTRVGIVTKELLKFILSYSSSVDWRLKYFQISLTLNYELPLKTI